MVRRSDEGWSVTQISDFLRNRQDLWVSNGSIAGIDNRHFKIEGADRGSLDMNYSWHRLNRPSNLVAIQQTQLYMRTSYNAQVEIDTFLFNPFSTRRQCKWRGLNESWNFNIALCHESTVSFSFLTQLEIWIRLKPTSNMVSMSEDTWRGILDTTPTPRLGEPQQDQEHTSKDKDPRLQDILAREGSSWGPTPTMRVGDNIK